MAVLLALLADGTLVAKNRSEKIKVPAGLYERSLFVFGRLLEQSQLT